MSPRHETTRVLRALGIEAPRLRLRDVVAESISSATRSPLRTVLSALGTALGVGAAVAIIGLSDTARAAVGAGFDALRATEVTFTDGPGSSDPSASATSSEELLTLEAADALAELNGVVSAGLIWDVDNGRSLPLRRVLDQSVASATEVTVVAASVGALEVSGTEIGQGRTYDSGMEGRRASVGLLGRGAAQRLGITRVDRAPVLYLGDHPITIVGVISDVRWHGQLLTSLVIPASLADGLLLGGDRAVIARTAPGAAQAIARQGPYAIAPLRPEQVAAIAPPDPVLLRNQVDGSLTSMLLGLSLVSLVIGVVAIANTTTLAVMQRRSEIGLRRAMGATPSHIAVLILTEAAIIGTVGGLLGASLGTMMISVFSAAKGWAPVLHPFIPLVGPLVGTLAGLLAGLCPALRATTITPIEAIQR